MRQYSSNSKSGQKNTLIKPSNVDNNNRSATGFRRNTSNSTLARGSSEVRGQHSLNNKNRYNSCTSIDYQRKERSASHMTSVD